MENRRDRGREERKLEFRIARAAKYDRVNIFITGPRGSGKTWTAALIHGSGRRSSAPFISLNCATLGETLADSELFGHEKGAFTGADMARQGAFRLADGGTLFLDEIAELAPPVQAKLLAVIESGEVRPLGSSYSVKVDVRLISATAASLDDRVREGKFRRDLRDRICQARIRVPPLAERRELIGEIALAELEKWNRENGEARRFDENVIPFLHTLEWEGNIRQLQNSVKNAVMWADELIGVNDFIETMREDGDADLRAHEIGRVEKDLRAWGEMDAGPGFCLDSKVDSLKRRYYDEALLRAGGNAERAACLLGVKPATFRKALRTRRRRENSGSFTEEK